jgi:hypothetical protein
MNQLTEVVDFIATLPAKNRTIDELTEMGSILIKYVPEKEQKEFIAEFIDRVSSLISEKTVLINDDSIWGDDTIRNQTPDPLASTDECDEPNTSSLSEDWDLDFPELRLRKDIWENFPVEVKPLGAGEDGAERHAIIWHRKNLADWRESRTSCFEEADNYESCCEYRLMKCLFANPRWTVEKPINTNQICVIRMNFENTTAVPTKLATESLPIANEEVPSKVDVEEWITVRRSNVGNVPTLLRLNDIKNNFPVVWHNIETFNGTTVYALEFHGKKLRDMSVAANRDVTEETRANLINALKASTAWRVLRSETPRELCRIEMA